MKSNFKRLGDYIRLVDERNSDMTVKRLLGINITKNFMPSVANTSETDLSKYKVIRKGQFAYSAMQVGRDETIRVALFNQQKPAIISPAYLVFEVIDSDVLLPEFIMMWFQRPESDRYGWFLSDGSVRASLEWERFSEIQIPISHIDEQRSSVALFNGLMSNQSAYERSLKDLQFICDSFMDTLSKTEESKTLGQYISLQNETNTSLEITNLLGVSVDKKFISSKLDKESLDLSKQKIVRRRQFAYVTVTSRNGEKISIALMEGKDGIVSNTYIVFDVIDKNVLLPEFLFLWFKRPEFDRYARFHSWGSARETFNWEDMSAVKLPIPDIEVQKSIVAIHHTVETRKRINEKLKSMIAPLCPILMRGVIENLSAI